MARIMEKVVVTSAVAGLLVLGGEVLSPSSASAYARTWRLAQYDTSGARIDRGMVGWHGRRLTGSPANPCTLAKAQQNRC
jgi:hypothetical protein